MTSKNQRISAKIKAALCSLTLLCGVLTSNIDVNAEPVTSAESAIVEVLSYEVIEGGLRAGEEITLQMTVQNVSQTTRADNIIMTYEADNNSLFPVYGEDNQLYIGSLGAGARKDISINLMVAQDYSAVLARLKIGMDYASGATIVSNDIVLNIPSYISGDLISESLIVAENATVGVNSLVSIRCKNQGTTDITDAKLIIEGNVTEESQEIALPTIGAGKIYTQDYYVAFSESGIQNLVIRYQYTDYNGEVCTVDGGEYKVNVITSANSAEQNLVVVSQQSGSSIVLQLVMLVCAAAAMVAVVVVYIKKRK